MKRTHMLLKDIITGLRNKGNSCTFLGVGPVSENVVKATFEVCKQYDCPPIFIASRNQVDLKFLGHGYLMGGMDQQAFVELLKRVQQQVGYEGPLYICRDHGGPWQRNKELDEKYPVKRAMNIAKESFRADIEAGFNYLHIDPTKCPFPHSQDDLCSWTVELVKFCEQVRKTLSKDSLDYEVGAEDIRGGLTEADTFEAFLRNLTKRLKDEGLPQPTCVVGQTGTLCRLDRNVGCFDRIKTAELAATAAKYGVGFKEHNGDYLSAASCRIHPDIGVAGINVAPEFGLVETDACLALADLERKLLQEGWLRPEDTSHFRELLLEQTFTNSPWKKWMTEDIKQFPLDKIQSDTAIRLLIARVCGHYVYNRPEVVQARRKLYENVNQFELVDSAKHFVVNRVKDSIEFYVGHFRLKGINLLIEKIKGRR